MSSGAVVKAILSDPGLISKAGGTDFVFPDYALEEAPRNGVFVILRWGGQDVTPGIRKGPVDLTVWVHEPVENSTDYTKIIGVLGDIRIILETMSDDPGPDGVCVRDVAFQGSSGNLYDPGFKTITKNSLYRVLLA